MASWRYFDMHESSFPGLTIQKTEGLKSIHSKSFATGQADTTSGPSASDRFSRFGPTATVVNNKELSGDMNSTKLVAIGVADICQVKRPHCSLARTRWIFD